MLRGKFVDDIMVRVREWSDDASLSRSQVAFWLDVYRDSLVTQYLNDQILKGKGIDSFYMERETLEMATEENSLVSDSDLRVYVELTGDPLSLVDDLGVVKVETTEGVTVLRARTQTISWIKDLPYAAPCANNLVFYRDSRKLVINGLKKNKTVDFIATYVPSYASQELTDEDEFKIHDALVPQLTEMVEDVARRELGLSSIDTQNNGEDNVDSPVRVSQRL